MASLSKGLLSALFLTAPLASFASAQNWQDDFESYAVDTGLEGQGGWENQNGVTTMLTMVSDDFARSGSQSAWVQAGASTVQPLPVQNAGVWDIKTHVYMPSNSNSSMLVRFLSTYQQSGQMDIGAWFLLDSSAGNVLAFAGQPAPFFLPLPLDQWIEVRAHIDLTADSADIYFDGVLVNTMVWSLGQNGQALGAVPQIAALQFLGATGAGVSTGSYVDDSSFRGEVGTTYCSPAVVNSTGVPATMRADGSTVAADNQLTLLAADMPMNAFGYVIVSETQGFSMNPGGSDGHLCLGGSVGRYVGPGQVMNTGTTGSFDLPLDLTQIPQPTGFVAAVAGDTWNFQAWYRDSSGGVATSNFTDGLSVTFQ